MPSTRSDEVSVADGTFDVHVVVPDAGTGPGLVLVQEIFGVGKYIRAVADRLARQGFVVAAPDVFWRFAPGHAAEHDEEGLATSIALVGQLDFPKAVDDCLATLGHLRAAEEVAGKVGVIGFCLGGSLAFACAVEGDPDCAVAYYGSAVPAMAGSIPRISCPVLAHFGDSDPFIPNEGVEGLISAAAGNDLVEVVVHEGGQHAFDNHEAPMFHQPDIAEAAWAQTTAFLDRVLR